jgi:hypothetical protein
MKNQDRISSRFRLLTVSTLCSITLYYHFCCSGSNRKEDMFRNIHSSLDYLGAALSFTCAIHCIAMPFLIASLPLIGLGIFVNPTAENYFIAASLVIASLSFVSGFRQHRKRRVLILFVVAAALLCIGRLSMSECMCCNEHFELSVPLCLAIFGGFTLAAAHLWNRHCIKCYCCTDVACSTTGHA